MESDTNSDSEGKVCDKDLGKNEGEHSDDKDAALNAQVNSTYESSTLCQTASKVEMSEDRNVYTKIDNVNVTERAEGKTPEERDTTERAEGKTPEERDTTEQDCIQIADSSTNENLKMSENRGEPLLCDPCKENKLDVKSAAFCTNCQESFCETCATVHRSQKATRQHVLNEYLSSDEAVFFCDTCFVVKTKTPATASCKECEELYCDPCSNAHRTQKASRTHNVTCHPELPKKSLCEPCGFNGKNIKDAVYVCVECDEVQCSDCQSVHVKQKLTRNHTVICPQASAESDLLCQPCFKTGQQTTPIKFCKVCFQLLCCECADTHRQDSSTREHKLQDISKEPEVMMSQVELKGGNVGKSLSSDSKYVKEPAEGGTNFGRESFKPGKPGILGQVHVDTINLVWEPPIQLYEDHHYQLRFKDVKENSKWKFHPELTASSSISLHNLKSDTQYVFQVRMVNDEIEGPYSDVSDTVETIQSAAQRLMSFMYAVEKPDINIALKKLPLQENRKTRNEQAKTRKLFIGDATKTHSRERTIMLVGATGTGKSTLVDGMINYILGVNWNDPYRLTLVDLEDEEMDRGVDQAVSQTQWITCYTINPLLGSRLDYTLNIIDTPGFGDTRGIDRDKEIIEQIRTLFSRDDEKGVLFIDAVCFLIKAPDARLTPTQMYIFNAIMSLFGQDIENNFCMLVTFADGKRPPVLAALKAANLPHEQFFPFNNSGLFADNLGENVSSFSPMFWDMGCKSFQMFLKSLPRWKQKA